MTSIRLPGSLFFHRSDYQAAQQLGKALQTAQSWGVYYPSVRAVRSCFGIMHPKALSNANHWRYLYFHYEKGRVLEVSKVH